jgi:hypothetical protein
MYQHGVAAITVPNKALALLLWILIRSSEMQKLRETIWVDVIRVAEEDCGELLHIAVGRKD